MDWINSDGITLVGSGSEWFWSALTGAVTAVTFVAIWKQLRLQAAAAAREQLLEIQREWNSERMLRRQLAAYEDLLRGPIPRNSTAWETCNYWEYVGALARGGHLNFDVMQMTLGGIVVGWWTLLHEEIEQARSRYDVPDLWENFEWLALRLARKPSATVNEAGLPVTAEEMARAAESLRERIKVEEALRTSPELSAVGPVITRKRTRPQSSRSPVTAASRRAIRSKTRLT